MRVSVLKADAGFQHYSRLTAEGKVVHVFLDDAEQRGCITADEEEGVIEREVQDTEGRPQVDPNDRSRIWTETVTGAVRVVAREPAHA